MEFMKLCGTDLDMFFSNSTERHIALETDYAFGIFRKYINEYSIDEKPTRLIKLNTLLELCYNCGIIRYNVELSFDGSDIYITYRYEDDGVEVEITASVKPYSV